MRNRVFQAVLAVLLVLAGCTRDPETVKRKYLENGDKYFAQGKYTQASIMYRNAIKRDARFGQAYLRLGDTELRRGDIAQAIFAYRRAIELLKDSEEPAGKLADIYLAGYAVRQAKDKRLLDEVDDLSKILLKKNPNSFHGLRLQGFLEVSRSEYEKAVETFRKADGIKPGQPELRFALASVLNALGRWEEAEPLLLAVVKDSPSYVTSYDFLIIEYGKRGRQADAESIAKKKVENNPKSARFRTQLASFYYLTQRPAEAEKVLNGILARESEFENGRMEVGDFYGRMRDYAKAREVFLKGAETDEKNRDSYRLKLALLEVAQSRPQEALKIVEQVLKDSPKNDDALSMRASLQLQIGEKTQTQAAITELQSLIGRMPANPVIRYNLAKAYQGRGEYDAARVQYSEALKLRPDFVAAHIGIGQVFLAKRDFGKALEAGEAILKLDPNSMFGRVIKANALINSGNVRQARLELEGYMKSYPDAPDLQFQMALVNFFEGHFQEAETAFLKLRERFPNDIRLAYAIAEVYMRTNKAEAALKFLVDEKKRFPDNLEVNKAVGNVAMRTGVLDTAEQEYRYLITKEPRNLEMYLRLGETLRRKGQTQASIDVLRKGQQLNPNDPQANLQLALTLDAAGLKRESLPLYENIVKNQPDNAIALNNLAFMLAEDGRDLDQALTYAQRARQQLPNNADVADTLGWIYIRKNLSDNAVSIFKDLTKKYRENPTYHYHLGMALYQKGDRDGARRSLQMALTLKPPKEDEEKIRELLAKVS